MKAELAIVALGLVGAVTLFGFRSGVIDRFQSGRASALEATRLARIRSAPTVQAVCDAIALALRANAIVVECTRGQVSVIAGSPWKTTLQPLDIIAANWSFQSGQPSGAGTNNSALSDWLFVPVAVGGHVVAVLAVAGRYCRRTFNPDDPAILDGVVALSEMLGGIAQGQRQLALG